MTNSPTKSITQVNIYKYQIRALNDVNNMASIQMNEKLQHIENKVKKLLKLHNLIH